jgi:HPt (histidine-containing phosphotransfer) domain-containing protein
MAASLKERNSSELLTTAHGFRGSSASFGAEALALLLKELELAVQRADWAHAESVYEDLKTEMETVKVFMTKELSLS